MIYLLKFKHKGKEYLLWDDGFCGGDNPMQVAEEASRRFYQSLMLDGAKFDMAIFTEMKDLEKAVGGVPFTLNLFSGGLTPPFYGVPLL